MTAGGETNTAWRHLHLYGDGKERRYFFDGAAPVRWGANYPDGIPADKWSGDIVSFRVVNDKTKEEVPVRDVQIVPDNPRLPPELILSHTKYPMALDRARRPVDVEVGVFNAETLAATGVSVRVEGLPQGVRVANPEKEFRICDLAGYEGIYFVGQCLGGKGGLSLPSPRGASWPPPSDQKGWTCLEPEQTGRWAASGAEPGKTGATSALTTFGHTPPKRQGRRVLFHGGDKGCR